MEGSGQFESHTCRKQQRECCASRSSKNRRSQILGKTWKQSRGQRHVLEAPHVAWYPSARDGGGKWKPARKSTHHFVLRWLDAHLEGIPFDPSLPAHLSELSAVEIQRIVDKVHAGTLVGQKNGMRLKPFSHADMAMLSLDRRDSSKAVNAGGSILILIQFCFKGGRMLD
ncbi:hypothetical protein BC830DRAFT_262610 [Chytriomyces sp. MP71]|nr:hypothetical protein BC830DRAFT_262610 [Chytriomyces sp. MP71]